MDLYERFTHWATTLEGTAWGAALYAAILYICPDLDKLDPTMLVALIPVVRGALARGGKTVATTSSTTVSQNPPSVTKETTVVEKT